MALTVTPLAEGERSQSDEKGVYTLVRAWHVEEADKSNVPTDDDFVAAAGVDRFDPHPDRGDLIARGHSCEPVAGDRYKRRVAWTYSNAPLELTGDMPAAGAAGQPPDRNQTASGNATGRLPTVTFSRREKSVPLEYDVLTDAKVVNTLDEPFDPPVEVVRSILCVTINYKSVLIDVPHILSFYDTVNATPWQGFNAETLRVVDIQVKQVYETYTPSGATVPAILSMYDVTVQLEYNRDTWKIPVLNRSWNEKKTTYVRNEVGSITSTTVEVQRAKDKAGQETATPVEIKADGTRCASSDEFHYLEFNGYLTENFDNLLK